MSVAEAVLRRYKRPVDLRPKTRTAIALGIAFAVVLVVVLARGPNLEPLLNASPVIQIHLGAAIVAFLLGGVLLLARKGRRFHIIAGWTWVIFMATVALVALFITEINNGWWSWIHILSGTTLTMLPLAVRAARKKNISAHRTTMMGLYFGGMIIAGGFTFLPGRLMHTVFIAG